MENKIHGFERHISLGITYLFFPYGIVSLVKEKETLSRDDKIHIWNSICWEGALIVISIICSILRNIPYIWWLFDIIKYAAEVVFAVFAIINAVKCFKNQDASAKYPVVTDIVATKIVPENK